jgi:phage/plasmid-like protein (TIGR03299 family)
MPGLLEIIDGKAMFVGVQPAWHLLGTVIDLTGTEEVGLTKEQVYEAVPVLGMKVRQEPIYWVDGETQVEYEIETHKAVVRDDGKVVGVNSSTYGLVQHDTVVDLAIALHGTGEARIVSGFTIRNGTQFCIACKVEREHLEDGVDYTPYIFVASSHNGTLPLVAAGSGYLPVCANMLQVALADSSKRGTQIRLRHSSNVMDRLDEARKVLRVTGTQFDKFDNFLTDLTQLELSNQEFDEMMAAVFPEDAESSKREKTVRDAWRDEIRMVYEDSDYVGQWKGTAFGGFQAVNTWANWGTTVRNTTGDKRADTAKIRAERQMAAQFNGADSYTKKALAYLDSLVPA